LGVIGDLDFHFLFGRTDEGEFHGYAAVERNLIHLARDGAW
jgi:hypothetical protein